MQRLSRSLVSVFALDPIQLDPGINTRTSRIQLLYGAWVNMTQLAIGLAMGFATVLIPHLSETESEMTVTKDESSWIASVLALFCPIGCIISGIAMDRHGRRVMLIFSQVPMFAGWLCTSLAKTPNALIIGRAITGVGCGMAMGPPRVYCTEIALPNMRGVIGSFPNVAVAIGITVQAGLGSFLHWHILCYICSAVSFFNFCSFTLLPESPYYVLQHKSEEEARNSLAKFRGANYNVDREMDQLRDFKEDNDFRKLSCAENLGVLFTKASCKPFVLMIIYVFLSQAVGNNFILFWTVELLEESNSSLNAEIGNIILGITRVVMSAVTAALLYRVGRRPLAIISALGTTIVCIALGVFLLSNVEPSLMPQISLMLYTCFGTLGYYTLPVLMAFELYPLQVRGILGGATISMLCFLMFVSTKVKPLMIDVLGLPYTFITFGCISLFAIIFICIYLPETKDLTLQEIEEYYKEIRPTLISQRRIMSLSQAAVMSRASINKSRGSVSKSKTALGGSEPAKSSGKLDRKQEDAESVKSTRSDDSKKLRVIFEETADEDYPRSRKKDEKSRKRGSRDDKDPRDGDDQPSTAEDYPRSRKKDEKFRKRGSRDDKDPRDGDDQPSTSNKK